MVLQYVDRDGTPRMVYGRPSLRELVGKGEIVADTLVRTTPWEPWIKAANSDLFSGYFLKQMTPVFVAKKARVYPLWVAVLASLLVAIIATPIGQFVGGQVNDALYVGPPPDMLAASIGAAAGSVVAGFPPVFVWFFLRGELTRFRNK